VVDYLDGNLAGFRLVEGAAGGAVQASPDGLVNAPNGMSFSLPSCRYFQRHSLLPEGLTKR
jgi:hypothetical protein